MGNIRKDIYPSITLKWLKNNFNIISTIWYVISYNRYLSLLGCHNKIPQTKWPKWQNVFFTVVETTESRAKACAGSASGADSPWLTGSCLLTVSSQGGRASSGVPSSACKSASSVGLVLHPHDLVPPLSPHRVISQGLFPNIVTSKGTGRDSVGGPVVRTLPSNAKSASSLCGQGGKIPHASGPKT